MKLFITILTSLCALSLSAQINHWETAVSENDTWKYLVPTSAVAGSWNTIGFNDASWLNGQGGFGYGDGDDNTVITNTISCYQRKVFNIVNTSEIELAVLNVDYDDSFVAYLNGTEITRDNITSLGQPGYNQSADGLHEAVMYQGGYPLQFIIDSTFLANNLVNGSNVLCVQTHNESFGSSDLSSRVFLHLAINNASNNYSPTPSWFMPPLIFTDSNLPIVVINTVGGVSIPDSPKVDATMGIIYNGEGNRNYLSDPFNEYFGNIGIETRGSSSQSFPKKQYGLETRDGLGNSNDVSLFNMAFDNDWVLFAPYSDKSLMRNALAYEMGWQTQQYAPRTQFCEVILNGSYDGVYILTEKIKRKDGKVGTDDIEPADNSGNQLTGDYVFKVDKTTAGGVVAWTSPFPHYAGASTYTKFQLHDPELDSLTATQLSYLQGYVTDFEIALDGPNFTDPIIGYSPWIDAESFADFMLVNELSKNVDGYRISTFLHKLRLSEGGKLRAGPLWDFNLAFGNANYCQGGLTTGWEIYFYQVCGGGSLQNPFWWEKLVQDPNFSHLLNCRYQELRQGPWHSDTLMARIDTIAVYLDEAQQRNFQRWPILGNYVWPNNFIGNTYYEEVSYLKSWLWDRLNWMDANMFGSCNDLGIEEFEQQMSVLVHPNPARTKIEITTSKLLIDGSIKIIDATGKTVLTRSGINGKGFKLNVSTLSSGIYFYQIQSEESQSLKGKISIVK